eukprot:GDKH01025102.1.p1 GENE.GDKH01025102.1~~GDKH01025102.1.p1  ORF type:complete len:322 (+),score=52.78 GDKH01025102.1:152-1117(+)
MSERKVINKYYPPDFDPNKLISRGKLAKQMNQGKPKKPRQMEVRMMMPFSMCCATCKEFVYIGTKFNSRVEKVKGEDYLGIAIWRFYGKCPNCRGEFAFKTDPKHAEYVLEAGGTRNYDARRDQAAAAEQVDEEQKAELDGDAMKALEHKTYNTANELLALEQLDELRKLNKRLLSRDETLDNALDHLAAAQVEVNAGAATMGSMDLTSAEQAELDRATRIFDGRFVSDEDSDDADIAIPSASAASSTDPAAVAPKKKPDGPDATGIAPSSRNGIGAAASLLKGMTKKRKATDVQPVTQPVKVSKGNLGSLLGGYGSDNSD